MSPSRPLACLFMMAAKAHCAAAPPVQFFVRHLACYLEHHPQHDQAILSPPFMLYVVYAPI